MLIMKNNIIKYTTKKTLIFGLAGAVGALMGDGLSELFINRETTTYLGSLIHVALWTGLISLGISFGLLISQNIYFKKSSKIRYEICSNFFQGNR